MHTTGQPYSDNDLIAGIRRGDQKAQYVLYKSYVDAMYHTAVRIVGNTAEAQDVVQESFIKVFDKIGSYRGEATIGAWIKRIVVNTAINASRKSKRSLEYSTDDTPDIIDFGNNDEQILDPQIVHHAIKDLPSGCRTILNLYAFEGYSHKEISGMLEITESTSKTQYRRAKHLLKGILLEKQKNDF